MITDWRQWWKEVSSRNYEFWILKPETEILRQTPWLRIRGQNSVNKELWQIVGSGKPTGSVLKETIAVSITISISVQKQHSRILLRALLRGRKRNASRTRSPTGKSLPVEECFDCPARITSKERAPINSVKNGILHNACSTSPRVDADLEKSALMRIARLMNSLAKGLKRMVTKEQWLCWKVHDNWVAYFRIWSRRSLHRFCGRAQTYGNQSDVLNSQNLSYVILTFETKIHRLEWFAQVIPHQRNPNAPKFADRSQEETVWQERCARESAWRLAKSILKSKEKKAAFFSPSDNWCLPAPRNRKPEEREFVVDSGASMHMISKKDLNSAEMDTLTTSRSPTTVITASGEVQTHEEATVYVKELDIFLTIKVLEDTPAVLSLGKLCDEHGYPYEWMNGQKPHLIKNGIRIQCNTENLVPIVVPGLSTSSSSSFLSSTSMTPSRQEIDYPTSSSSSSTSPTMTVSSDNETGAREDLCGIDSYPVSVSSKHVERKERGDPLTKPTKNPKPNKNEDHDLEKWDPLHSDIPGRLQEFKEHLVDDRVPERRDSHASSSHEPSLELTFTRSVDLGKHSVYTYFPKERNCEICQRTKITRAPCRGRIGGAVPRADNFGDLISADHKVLSEGCDFWNNHRYAIVVQDFGHPMDPVVSVQNKNFSGSTN